ncbi:unnamed protein product [Caenorhabditis bovis]|uniref:Uncharacterized protein n=1 Tax=Caenorhabditis bovis TaxID=2654633 RepID=A0A8S1ETD9_9PELO|nr:unnamed protein product [Caenorhabditis bovis]
MQRPSTPVKRAAPDNENPANGEPQRKIHKAVVGMSSEEYDELKVSFPIFFVHSFEGTAKCSGGMRCTLHDARVKAAITLKDIETEQLVSLAVCEDCAESCAALDTTIDFNGDLNTAFRITFPFDAPVDDRVISTIWYCHKKAAFARERHKKMVRSRIFNWPLIEASHNVDARRVLAQRNTEYDPTLLTNNTFTFIGITRFIKKTDICGWHVEDICGGVVVRPRNSWQKLIYCFCPECMDPVMSVRYDWPDELITMVRLAFESNDCSDLEKWFQNHVGIGSRGRIEENADNSV